MKGTNDDPDSTTIWSDTVKTAITSPFQLLCKYGVQGTCKVEVITYVLRLAFHHAWTEKTPGTTAQYKTWGPLRNFIVEEIIALHPDFFAPTLLADLPLAGGSAAVSLAGFMTEFFKTDAASAITAAGESASPRSSTDGLGATSTIVDQAHVFRRISHDAEMMLRLTTFASVASLNEWGWEMIPAIKECSQ